LHEYDHLHGIQYMNRVSKLKYDMAVKKRDKLRRKVYG
jgi:peptide deformylase